MNFLNTTNNIKFSIKAFILFNTFLESFFWLEYFSTDHSDQRITDSQLFPRAKRKSFSQTTWPEWGDRRWCLPCGLEHEKVSKVSLLLFLRHFRWTDFPVNFIEKTVIPLQRYVLFNKAVWCVIKIQPLNREVYHQELTIKTEDGSGSKVVKIISLYMGVISPKICIVQPRAR